MRHILFVSAIIAAAFTYSLGQVREPSLEKGQIEDLKGIIKVYVGTSSPSTSRSTTLTIIETVHKRLPQITFVSLREEADVWLLFSAEGDAKDISVRGRIIRSLGPGRLRLVKQYSAEGKKGAEGFAEEFVKSFRKANHGPQADIARLQQGTSLPPRLKGKSGPAAGTGGLSSVRTAGGGAELGDGDILRTDTSLVTTLYRW